MGPPGAADAAGAGDGARGGPTPGDSRTITMLVLTRKLMEKLYIGDAICVTGVRLEGGQVRLGIEAPREIPVVRAELLPGRLHEPLKGPSRPVDPAGPVRTRPAEARGIGSRRRGPSR